MKRIREKRVSAKKWRNEIVRASREIEAAPFVARVREAINAASRSIRRVLQL
jgi:hypothetical protein